VRRDGWQGVWVPAFAREQVAGVRDGVCLRTGQDEYQACGLEGGP